MAEEEEEGRVRSLLMAKEEDGEGDPKADNGEEEDDIASRFEFEIQQSIAGFVDEEPINPNVILDSDDEFEFRREGDDRTDKFSLGNSCFTGFEFKEVVLEYVLRTWYNIRQERWEKTKLSYKCGIEGCKWRVYCSFDKPKQMWLVKTRNEIHMCTPNGKCQMFKSPVIARLFMDRLRLDEDQMPEKIQDKIKENWKIVNSRNQCQRGRQLALKWLDKEFESQLAHLRGYVKELLISNPGTTAFVETTTNAAGEDVFNRFYVCFENIRITWRGYCRKVIGLDGTFLKVYTKGVLLVAVGQDANNQIYPIAWAVVQYENADNWLWFIKQIKSYLLLGNGEGYVKLSDNSKV